MDYCFQQDLSALSEPEFKSSTVEAFIQGFDLALVATYFPNFFNMVNSVIFALPENVRKTYFAPVHGFQTMQRLSRERLEYLIDHPEKRDAKVPSMFDAMLNPDTSKGQVTPPMGDMVADGCLMIAAGTDTTANALGTILFHVTQNPDVEERLLAELKAAIPDKNTVLDSATLEGDGFEYMRAVVREGLRLAVGVPGRIPRKAPAEGVQFGSTFIPGGVSLVKNVNPYVDECTDLLIIDTTLVRPIFAKY